MDPGLFNFSSSSALPQESKLVTYMNLSSATSNLSHQLPSISSPKVHKKITHEFIPGTYFAGVDGLPSMPKESSPTLSSSLTSQMAANAPQVHQENVGGTTYFYAADSVNGSHVQSLVSHQGITASMATAPPHMYTGTPTHVSNITSMSGLAATFHMPDVLRAEIMHRNLVSLSHPNTQGYPDLPVSVEQYVELCPLEEPSMVTATSSVYRALHRISGQLYALRRLHGFRLAPSKGPLPIDRWKKLQHPNIVQLREVFTTKAFGDQSLVFVYDYHPGSVTLAQKYMSTPVESTPSYSDPFNNADPDAPRPYSHQKNTILRAAHNGNIMSEATIWSLLVQLTAALRAIHAAGLACRKLDLSKVIVSGYRLRVSWCGVASVSGQTGGVEPEQAQQDDLTALGRLVLALATRGATNGLQIVARTYSADLNNLILYLLAASPRRSVTDLMPMIGARFYTQVEALQRRADTLEDQLAMEMDNGRLYRLLVKLCSINERPELNMDGSWAETDGRYMLKLFRDYLFHSVLADGRPWLDYAHLTSCLNQLDSGTQAKVQLMSRDEQSVLLVSYAELKHCLEQAFDEIVQASAQQ